MLAALWLPVFGCAAEAWERDREESGEGTMERPRDKSGKILTRLLNFN